jgi:hypothetical protein
MNAKKYGKYLQIRITSLGSVADPKLFIPGLKSTFQIMPDLDPAADPNLKPGLLKTGLVRLSA